MSYSILLDLDGTLTDPFPGISRSIKYALINMSIPIPEAEDLRSWIGPPLLDSFRNYFESLAIEADQHAALQHYRERFSEKGLFENEVYDGIEATLIRFREAGCAMYLATAKPHVYAKRIVEHFGLDTYLTGIHGAELDGTRTDKVELLQFIIEQEGLTAADCVMIGDRRHDMEAAQYHGMKAIGVLWGYGSKEELLEAGAEDLVDSPGDLLTVIS